MLVGFGATSSPCAFYPTSGAATAVHRHELKDFDTSKGAIRFQPEKQPSVTLVRKLIRSRIAETA